MKMIKILGWCCFSLSLYAQAAIVFSPTRLVVRSSDVNGVIETLRNTTQSTAFLVQTYVSYFSNLSPAQEPVSELFQVVPPLVRIDGQGQAVIRVVPLPTLAKLPQDRESVFYFNAKAIPGLSPLARKPAERNSGASVDMTVTTRLKLFYRPEHLLGSQNHAFASVQFIRKPGVVIAKNASPYYVVLGGLSFAGKIVPLQVDRNNLLPPYGEQDFPALSSATTVQWSVLDDDGASHQFTGLIH